MAQRAWIDDTTPGANGHRRAAIRVHDGTTLTAADVFVIDDIPCTTLARTLLDVAEDATRATSSARSTSPSNGIDMRAIDDVLARADGRRGAKLLRAVLAEHTIASTLTRNDLEEAFLAIARAAELPRRGERLDRVPRRRRRRGDFIWHDQHLIVEIDGRDPTPSAKLQHRPQTRCTAHAARLARVRFTWQQVPSSTPTCATLRGLLNAAQTPQHFFATITSTTRPRRTRAPACGSC